MPLRSWISDIDAFRRLPKDLSEATFAGGLMTVTAAVICSILFAFELCAFLTPEPHSGVVLDSNLDDFMQINLDITMLDMACDHVTLGVWDAFGSERQNVTRNIIKQRIDHTGSVSGHSYSEDELIELEYGGSRKTVERSNDSDWGSTSDHFENTDFDEAVSGFDFTMVYFYADWCPHCMEFGPTFGDFAARVNSEELEFKDADGFTASVRALKMNCANFGETCAERGVDIIPSIRLYRPGQSRAVEFDGTLKKGALELWTEEEAGKRHLHVGAAYHDIFTESCRVSGSLEVARVPGVVHLAGAHTRNRSFNLAFTNTSHVINTFSFGKDPDSTYHRLPKAYRHHARPMDGMTFTVDKFHQATHHFLRVVHTRFDGSQVRSYQQTHQWNTRTIPRDAIPQVKFSYDISPMEVVVSKGERRWYDFMTSISAIIGGAFTVMSMTAGCLNVASAQFKANINKLG